MQRMFACQANTREYRQVVSQANSYMQKFKRTQNNLTTLKKTLKRSKKTRKNCACPKQVVVVTTQHGENMR